jgi:hypothetical protein
MKTARLWLSVLFLMALALAMMPAPAQAQEPAYIVSTLQPIAEDTRAAVNAWLASTPPFPLTYYAVTYAQPTDNGTAFYICLVALNLTSPDEEWSFTGRTDADGNFVPSAVGWFGTVKVFSDGAVILRSSSTEQASASSKMAAPLLGPGGGTHVTFPWQPAKAVQYGLAGVHPAGYSLADDWRAVDLLSGSDLGSGAANDKVYASTSGTVDYVCDDGTTVAIKTDNGNDEFIYAHLLDNANLEIDHSFNARALIGSLKHGSFTDSCGTALQTAQHWHLHWGFRKGSNNTFRVEGCFLFAIVDNYLGSSAGVWQCGTEKIKPRDWLYHYGNIAILEGEVDLTGADGMPTQPRFFTFLLTGLKAVFDAMIGNTLPEHNSAWSAVTPVLNGVKIIFRIVNVLLRGNFNLIPAMTAIAALITLKLFLTPFSIAGAIMRIIKSLPGMP